ncbi:dTDP-4-dehydrorhamnose reductase [Robertkochia sediminum]|uniref:dTDP-4-dehydrorhamnose reductase n=1 Tax=Robertkochia sediminum TaxID=2785326 RepID=UPI0019325207|nr:dTDP-4-dehydrorhamnose reductase [Robertkochia sediminum]MBL7471754.1 dTDP-4-dehydrorhamnose reductase [Robertkochia sediminum]
MVAGEDKKDPVKVLVTGASGQLGMTLQKYYGAETGMQWSFFNSKELDICDPEALAAVFEDLQPDYCINCAAYTNVEKAESEPERAFKVNAEAVKSLAEQCKKHEAILIHISTDYVFDGTKGAPYTPDDRPNPLNVYGKSKLAGEQFIQEILEHYYIVRTSWLYSKEFGHNFYRTIKAKAEKGESLKVVDDQVGCPTNTVNLSRHIVGLINNTVSFGVKHFCDGEAMSWYDFAQRIIMELRSESTLQPMSSTGLKQLAVRPPNSVMLTE